MAKAGALIILPYININSTGFVQLRTYQLDICQAGPTSHVKPRGLRWSLRVLTLHFVPEGGLCVTPWDSVRALSCPAGDTSSSSPTSEQA